jgi:hypothetical protein
MGPLEANLLNYPDHLYTISGVEVTDMTAVVREATEFIGEKSIRPLKGTIARYAVFCSAT